MKTGFALFAWMFGSAALAVCLIPALAEDMNLIKLHVDTFTVAGMEARTSNAQERSSDARIPKLWTQLRDQDLLNRIPNRVDSRIVALYTDYDSDKDGPYTYLLGAKVSSAKGLPAGLTSRAVASGNYAMFTAQGGPSPQAIVDLWKHIWSLEKPGPLHRAYKTDFEVYYGALDPDPSHAHVDVYVGLQK